MEQPSWINRTLNNRYKIEALLGQGGMSAVYKATDPNLKRVVAIKLIHPHLASDSNFVARFEEEAAAVAKLRHPNIVQVFDFDVEGDVYYMVLEFIPGETLQDRLKRINLAGRLLSIEDAVKFTINICDAIDYAHKQGIIHRDIKPANIMLDVHGQAILMDFGIVKIIGGDSHTATGAVLGTARYMSPEVIRSEVPDPRSDIYSLGITLFEMVSGEPPFNADSAMSLMMMQLNDPVPDISAMRNDVPAVLANIIYKALEKDPAHRFNTAGEMAEELKQALSELEKESASPTPALVPDKLSQDQTELAREASVVEDEVEKLTTSESQVDEIFAGEQEKIDVTAQEEAVGYAETAAKTVVESKPSMPDPTPTTGRGGVSAPSKPATKKSLPFPMVGAGIAGVILIVAIIFGITSLLNRNGSDTLSQADLSATLPAAGGDATDTPTPEPEPLTDTLSPTATFTSTPTETATPTNTLPPLYVRINGITVNASNQYVVEYETFGYTETLPGMHVHFFFDTVPPEEAGLPGGGPWILYGGPRPFTGYYTYDKPAAANQMCALVAYADHSIILESGNCYDLP